MSVLQDSTRQSKGLPSSHYLIIGIILREPLMDEWNSDEPPSRLSNDHLERSFVRTTGGRAGVRCKARSSILCARTYFSTTIFLSNFSLKLPLFYRKRKKKKKKEKEWADRRGRLRKTSGPRIKRAIVISP